MDTTKFKFLQDKKKKCGLKLKDRCMNGRKSIFSTSDIKDSQKMKLKSKDSKMRREK